MSAHAGAGGCIWCACSTMQVSTGRLPGPCQSVTSDSLARAARQPPSLRNNSVLRETNRQANLAVVRVVLLLQTPVCGLDRGVWRATCDLDK